MENETVIKQLHPLEVRLLRHVRGGEQFGAARLQAELAFNQGQCNQVFSWLFAKGLIEEKSRALRVQVQLTELGREAQEKGTAEERILRLLREQGGLTLPKIASHLGLENREVGSAYGALAQEGLLGMNSQKQAELRVPARTGGTSPADAGGAGPAVSRGAGPAVSRGAGRLEALRSLLDLLAGGTSLELEAITPQQRELAGELSRKRGAARGLFRLANREEIAYSLTAAGEEVREALLKKGINGEEIGVLTAEALKSGQWRRQSFRSYNIQSPPARVLAGRKNPYVEFLEELKNKLISLGFEEYDGPLLETEFWNSDALFMPQFHSARDIHDVYYVKEPKYARRIEQPYLDQVAATHENGWRTGSLGWRYRFDRQFTRRMILRSHGTVLSAKTLTRARVPGKYFGVVRCFRYDRVDATHLADFYQTEGIVLGEAVNLRTLLGLLKMFAEEVAGAKEIKYVPGYFPFTEPSVEVHIRHPKLGWFELGGSGIFRPEVTLPLGIKVPVLAWGLGIERMALMALGLNDLRDLFTQDLEQVRLRRRR